MNEREEIQQDLSCDEGAFFQEDQEAPDPMGIGQQMRAREKRRLTRIRILVSVMVLVGLVLIYWLHEELFYFFRSQTPDDLGLAEDLQPVALGHNNFVHIEGVARDMCIRAQVFSGRMRFFYFLGSEMGGRILVQTAAPESEGCAGAVERAFEGRLQDLSKTGRYSSVLEYYRSHFPAAPRSGPIYMLRDGDRPRNAWWYPLIFLAVLVLCIINIRTLWRLYRYRGRLGVDGEPA